jgi:GntR family transcriptional regulator
MRCFIQIHIDFRSGVSITNQIFEQTYDQIVHGELNPGDQLPTVRVLAEKLKVNFNTVARAYRLLDNAGLISTQQGRGTYVLPVVHPGSSERLGKLDDLTKKYLQKATELEASDGEILAIFLRNLRNWTEAEELREAHLKNEASQAGG